MTPRNQEASCRRPKLSVSIVVFKESAKQLCSVLSCLGAAKIPMLITVVDNSPSDELRHVAEAAKATYIFSGTNRGFGSGHNLVLREKLADFPYHLVLNADVEIPPQTIETLTEFMDANPNVGLVAPKVLSSDGSEQGQARRLPTPLNLLTRRLLGSKALSGDLHLSENEPSFVPFLSGCFMLLRGSVLEKSGLFDERFFLYMEDVDLSRRIGDFSNTVYHPSVKIYHHHARGSYKNYRMLWIHICSAILYFNKWGWMWDRDRQERNVVAGRPVTVEPLKLVGRWRDMDIRTEQAPTERPSS